MNFTRKPIPQLSIQFPSGTRLQFALDHLIGKSILNTFKKLFLMACQLLLRVEKEGNPTSKRLFFSSFLLRPNVRSLSTLSPCLTLLLLFS